MPDEIVDLSADLAQCIRDARTRIPAIVAEIEDVVRAVDPIELLSQLSMLYLTHPIDTMPNRDAKAEWQVRIEWLAWLIFTRTMKAPALPVLIDAQVLVPLEALLQEYVRAVAMTVMEPVEGLTASQNRLRASLQTEALFVRGSGFQAQLESLAVELYSSHSEWCLANVGLTVQDAFVVARAVGTRYTRRISELREASAQVEVRIRESPASAVDMKDLPLVLREALQEGKLEADGEQFARSVGMIWLFWKAPEAVGFTVDELIAEVGDRIPADRVTSFLTLLGTTADAIEGEPNPLALSPLAFTPLVREGDRFFLFVPPLLFESVFYAFHRKLFFDAKYRSKYDDVRAEWLEASAIDALRGLLPAAQSGWGLEYGPKGQRTELDGLLLYDNKLILVECKWKSPRLVSLEGDVKAALDDVDKAILAPLSQAKRARDYISGQQIAQFEEKATGRLISVESKDVSEVFLVTLVGSGAWAQVAANLPELAPMGFFADGEYPWALSISDLRVVTHCLELPSQLFHYLRMRYEVQRDGRFRLHDEWDFLGVYLFGALDPQHPKFADAKDANGILLDAFDSELQDYYYSLSAHVPLVEKPHRKIPKRIFGVLADAERSGHRGITDAICAVLNWPDDELTELDGALDELRRKTILDGKAHAVTAKHPWKPTAIAMACGYKNKRAIRETVMSAVTSARRNVGAAECVGFEWDLGSGDGPTLVFWGAEAADGNYRE